MKLQTTYSGGDDLFEGDRTVQLRSLPIGARALSATVKLAPVASAGGTLFEEDIDHFVNGRGDVNTTKVTGTDFVEVDFHARRTLASATGVNILPMVSPATPGANLEVDVGGTLIEVNSRGALGGSGSDLFTLKADSALPGLTVNKFRLTKTGANPDVTTVTIRSVPTNLTVKLGQTPPFWVRVGELAGPETSPDFAQALNAFLLTAPSENRFYQIPFVIHSDTLARLDVELNIEYVIEQAVLPPHLPEINLSYDFSTLPSVDEALTTIRLPRAAMPVSGRTGARIQGQFQPTRVAGGPIGEDLIPVQVEVSPQCSLAQAIVADREIDVVGIDLPLGKTRADVTGLNVALRADDDGKPTSDVLASAEVKVAKPIAGPSTWGTVTLPAPFRMLPNVRYWLVLQSRDNVATWNATAGQAVAPADQALPVQCSRDGGLSWRAATARDTRQSLSALLRLREKPDRFSVPVQLQIGKGPGAVRRRLDEYAPSGRIEFNFDFAEKLTEHLGQLQVTSRCNAGERLLNGNFDQPGSDDASERLLGKNYDGGTGTVDLSRGVDLSIERFLTLSIEFASEGPSIWRTTRIDCAGVNPARTTIGEIVANINQAAGSSVAEAVDQGTATLPAKFLKLQDHGVEVMPWCSTEAPFGWQRASGTVVRGAENGLYWVGLGAVPDDLAWCSDYSSSAGLQAPSELMQRFAVTGDCGFRLRFIYRATSSDETLSSGRWQVRWFDRADQLLGTDEAPLDPIDPQSEFRGPVIYERQLNAPQAAVQAELHFIQSPAGILALAFVSFACSSETLSDTRLRLWETRDGIPAPVHWNMSGEVDRTSTGAVLRGDHLFSDDSMLSQVVTVSAGKLYQLTIHAPWTPASNDDPTKLTMQQPTRVELRWLDDSAQPVGSPLILALDVRRFSVVAWSDVAPAGAHRAEVRLIQPRGRGNLIVESVSLTQVDQVDVPLIFLAETPGALTISNLRVAYDLPEQQDLLDAITSHRAANARMVWPAITPFVRSTTTLPPITAITGIGEARARHLAAIGIDTMDKLAAASPTAIAQAIKGVTSEMAGDFVVEAQHILASGHA